MGYVYKLLKSGTVVYVGQALDIERRVKQHRRDDRIAFDDIEFFTVELSDMDSIEADTAFKCQPEFNRKMPPNNKYIAERDLLLVLKELLHDSCYSSKVGNSFYYTNENVEHIASELRKVLR